jgi:hypothetical protein
MLETKPQTPKQDWKQVGSGIVRDLARLTFGSTSRQDYIRETLEESSQIKWSSIPSANSVEFTARGIIASKEALEPLRDNLREALTPRGLERSRYSIRVIDTVEQRIKAPHFLVVRSQPERLQIQVSVAWSKRYNWLCPLDIDVAKQVAKACQAAVSPESSTHLGEDTDAR